MRRRPSAVRWPGFRGRIVRINRDFRVGTGWRKGGQGLRQGKGEGGLALGSGRLAGESRRVDIDNGLAISLATETAVCVESMVPRVCVPNGSVRRATPFSRSRRQVKSPLARKAFRPMTGRYRRGDRRNCRLAPRPWLARR